VEYKTGLHEKNLFTNNKIPSESWNQIIEYEDSRFMGCYRVPTDKYVRRFEVCPTFRSVSDVSKAR
jgi:hypothetical protein